ncbi:MAG: hypothetical protein AAGA18_13515 [Verrucomicrobiota bacterium]
MSNDGSLAKSGNGSKDDFMRFFSSVSLITVEDTTDHHATETSFLTEASQRFEGSKSLMKSLWKSYSTEDQIVEDEKKTILPNTSCVVY